MWPNRCLRHVEYHTNITGKSFFGFLDVIVSYNSTFSGDCAYNCIIFHASGEAKGQPDPSLVVSVIHRGRQNEDTLWRQLCWRDHVSQMLTRFATRATLVSDTNFVSWTQKMFLKIFRNISCFRTARNNVADGQRRRTQCCRHNVSSFCQGLNLGDLATTIPYRVTILFVSKLCLRVHIALASSSQPSSTNAGATSPPPPHHLTSRCVLNLSVVIQPLGLSLTFFPHLSLVPSSSICSLCRLFLNCKCPP